MHSHRSALAAQLLTIALGSKNRFDPNSQDSNPRLFACMQVYGDALTMPVPDVDRTDHLLMLGANPAASNGSMMGLGNPKRRFADIRERGGKIVLVDPRRTETAAWCTSHHFIRPGGDAALLLAMLHVLFEERRASRDLFRIASGDGELRALAESFSPERVGPAVAIDASDDPHARARSRERQARAVYARVGVCQNEFGPVASWLVEALNLVTGNFDREGGAMFPTAGGRRRAARSPAHRQPLGPLALARARAARVPRRAPFGGDGRGDGDAGRRAESARSCASRETRWLRRRTAPRLERALEKLDFFVAIDFYVNETSRHAHVLLPPKHVFETGNYDVLLSRFMVRNAAKYSAPIVETKDDTRDDWSIACEIVARLHAPRALRGSIMRSTRNLPEQLVDVLLRTGPHKLRLRDLVRAEHGIDLGPLVPLTERRVFTPDGRARLAPTALAADVPRVAKWVDAHRDGNGAVVMIGRRHLRSNNSWMHNVRSLAKGPDRARLMVHPTDASRLSLVDGKRARIKSRVGEVSVVVAVTDEVMPGVVSLPHGFGHQAAGTTLRIAGGLAGTSANVLTDEELIEPIIGTSILNGVPVTIEREEDRQDAKAPKE